MKNITIRKGTKQDFPHILQFIKDLAKFEKAEDKVSNSVEQMEDEAEMFYSFVAETEDGKIIGFALCFFAYFTWVGKSLYLDDLYIEPEYRRQKIGSRLMNEVFNLARESKCKRLRWQVLDWNSNAIEMYKNAGATLDGEWINCNFDESGISNFRI